jgi:hypothetical protein
MPRNWEGNYGFSLEDFLTCDASTSHHHFLHKNFVQLHYHLSALGRTLSSLDHVYGSQFYFWEGHWFSFWQSVAAFQQWDIIVQKDPIFRLSRWFV